MSNSVENRIVQMTFDNATFERKLETTLKSLDALNAKLDMSTAKKGISDLSTAGRNFNLSGMSASIEGVSAKFLALSTIGITVLSNIANRAVDAGISLAKSLSLDNIIGGFREYELNIGSIQTILANTKSDGTTLQEVNDALDELNNYADKTIYNFAQMTKNIGTFTAAGVDLDTATRSIKGIANLAAISGSNSQQASTAMYQLSQAISTGSLKLQDWNSVVNAGLGGEVFQTALFEAGKAMGTLVDVPVEQTFDEWKDAGNTFRNSLQDGWITADVLTQTLEGLTGELTEADLAAAGFGEDAIKQFIELGETGVEAATKVRTITQLFDTLGEAIGSGWSGSFRIVLGDFEEATELFTGISGALDRMVSSSADARNELLQGWKDLGGREVLIRSLQRAFEALSMVFKPIKDAFRDIFPKKTSYDLFQITLAFSKFTQALVPTGYTMNRLQRTFRGLFNVVKVVFDLVAIGGKKVISFFKDLTGVGEGNLLKTLAKFGDILSKLTAEGIIEKLGELTTKAFDKIQEAIDNPKEALLELKDTVFNFFKDLKVNIGVPDILEDAFARLEQRFEGLSKLGDRLGNIWSPIQNAFNRIKEIFGEITDYVKDWFSELGNEMADAAEPGDFNAVLDVVNVGLLGGITALLTKLTTGGFKFDLGNGFFENAAEALEEVGGVLRAMQADLKANALLKIAGAIGVLAISIAILATIDSAALTRALTAISVGLAQLVGTFAIFSKLALGPTTTAKFAALGLGLTLLAGSLLLLAVATKLMSTMSWEEIAKGLTSVTALLAALSAAVIPLSANSSGMIRAGIGIGFLAVGLNLLGLAMKLIATMSWEEIAKGLTGVAGGLLAVTLAMNAMPTKALVKAGGSILLISVGLNALAASMLIFATMSWEDIGKGLTGVAGGLLGIALAMNLMPATLPVTGVGLAIIAGSMVVLAEAMTMMAGLSWEEMGRGLAGMAGSLVILAGAAYLMSGTLLGAVAIGVMAGSLTLLGGVVKEFAGIGWGQLAKGLGALAITLGVIAGVSLLLAPAAVAIAGLGAAMILLGTGFALFGLGAQATAKAFQILAKAGEGGIAVFMKLIDSLLLRLPELAKALAEGLIEFGQVFLKAAPVLIEQLGVVILQILETLRELIPEFTAFAQEMLGALITVISDKAPDLVALGAQLLLDILKGIRDNIAEITTVTLEIIGQFLQGLADGIPSLLGEIVDLFNSLLTSVAYEVGAGAPTLMYDVGTALMDGLWDGITAVVGDLGNRVGELIDDIIGWFKSGFGIFSPSRVFHDLGIDLMVGLLNGIVEAAVAVTQWFIDLPGNVLGWIGDVLGTLVGVGEDIVTGFLDGVKEIAERNVKFWFTTFPNKVKRWIGNTFTTLNTVGKNLLKGFYNGGIEFVNEKLIPWFTGLPKKIIGWIGSTYTTLKTAGKNLIIGLWNGIVDKVGWIKDKISGLAGDVLGWMKSGFGIFSPSRETRMIGNYLGEGLGLGIDDEKAYILNKTQEIVDATAAAFAEIAKSETPTITPVLDLSNIKSEAAKIGKIVNFDGLIDPTVSYAQARNIASTEFNNGEPDREPAYSGPSEINFEQTINAPTELSTADIYRQTRNIITLAKEELDIP